MATVSREVRQYVDHLVKQGITRPGDVQSALKERFGKGLMFKDLGPLLRAKGKTPPRTSDGTTGPRKTSRKKKARVQRAAASAPATGRRERRGRPALVTPERRFAFVVMFRRDGSTEVRGTHSKAEAAEEVQSLVDAGVSPGDIALYERNDFQTTTIVDIR